MATALLDAAFRLVSHSLLSQADALALLATAEARLAELRRQFPDADPRMIDDAYARALRLEKTAIEMAGADRGRGPPLTRETLAERCPGFSNESYIWAINDGYVLTRK